MYFCEKFVVYLIRRGFIGDFWTGRRWSISPYEAKLYGQVEKAKKVIAASKMMRCNSRDPVQIVRCTLQHGSKADVVWTEAQNQPATNVARPAGVG